MDAAGSGEKSVRSGDDGISCADSHRHEQGELGIGSRRHPDGMATAEVLHEIVFERLDFGAQDITTVPQHTEGGLPDSLIDLGAETAQVEKRNGHGAKFGGRYFTTPNSARRFLAQAASLLAGSTGISEPKLTVWTLLAFIP